MAETDTPMSEDAGAEPFGITWRETASPIRPTTLRAALTSIAAPPTPRLLGYRTSTPWRYLVFAGNAHYAANGWYDCRGVYATLKETLACLKLCEQHGCGWYQIVDLTTLLIVDKGPLGGYETSYGDCGEDDLADWNLGAALPLPLADDNLFVKEEGGNRDDWE